MTMLSEQSLIDIESVADVFKNIFVREIELRNITTAEGASALAGMVMGALQVKFTEAMAKATANDESR
jgi:hypothetical protein